MADMKRVQLDLPELTVDDLDNMKDESGQSSRAAVIRESLYAYKWMIRQKKSGRRIVSLGSDGNEREFCMPSLEAIKA